MRHAGFVLTGGRSSRMGRDKALLPYLSGSLADHVAKEVREATPVVNLIGDPDVYGHLGYPVYADQIPGRGPLSGIHTAVSLRQADWNLILACDLPNIRSAELRQILEAADAAGATAECVVPSSNSKVWQPLCAAYHARCLPKLENALTHNRLKMMELLEQLNCVVLSDFEPNLFLNVNTPADWAKIEARQNV